MRFRTVSVNELRPAPYNPRLPLQPGTPAYDRLARSLREFELVQPIVWNEQTGHVVSGHQRLEILKHQGVTELEVVVVSLSLEREQALNITLNNSRVGSDWDPDKLISLLDDLIALPDFDATLTGFTEEDLQELILTPDPDWQPEPAEESETLSPLTVTLESPRDQWPEIRKDLDALIARWNLIAHIQG